MSFLPSQPWVGGKETNSGLFTFLSTPVVGDVTTGGWLWEPLEVGRAVLSESVILKKLK